MCTSSVSSSVGRLQASACNFSTVKHRIFKAQRARLNFKRVASLPDDDSGGRVRSKRIQSLNVSYAIEHFRCQIIPNFLQNPSKKSLPQLMEAAAKFILPEEEVCVCHHVPPNTPFEREISKLIC